MRASPMTLAHGSAGPHGTSSGQMSANEVAYARHTLLGSSIYLFLHDLLTGSDLHAIDLLFLEHLRPR